MALYEHSKKEKEGLVLKKEFILQLYSSRILTKSSIYPFEEKTKEENVQSYPSKEVRYTNLPTKVSKVQPRGPKSCITKD